MALVFIHRRRHPTYTALSTDISLNKIDGAIIMGGSVFLTDTGRWKIIKSDLTLGDYYPAGVPLEANGGVPVNLQDQHSLAVNALFSQQVSDFTLALPTAASTVDTLYYEFTAGTGHGIVIGNELLLLDVAGDRVLQCKAINVAADVITIDRPIDHIFPVATTLGRVTTSQMAVVGSLAVPKIFTVRAGSVPIDVTMLKLEFSGGATAMDDGKFGGQAALTNGLVLRIMNSFQATIFNFKTNADMKLFGLVEYSDKAPAGKYGMTATFRFAGQNERGVTLRVADTDVIQWVVQDSLAASVSIVGSEIGHEVTD